MKFTNEQFMHSYQINCEECCGLCCVSLYFSKIDGFPYDKKAGVPCKHLCDDHTCNKHDELTYHNWHGCMAYDCFGAGPFITKQLRNKPNWKKAAAIEAEEIFKAYRNVMQMHQTLWYVKQAITVTSDANILNKLHRVSLKGDELHSLSLFDLSILNLTQFRKDANQVLKQICDLQRPLSNYPNFAGKNFSHRDLSHVNFSMSSLIAANLEGANLNGTNFLGADMRDVNIKHTDLSNCLFLTQFQINSAHGDIFTKLPSYLNIPIPWIHP